MTGEKETRWQLLDTIGAAELFDFCAANTSGFLHHDSSGPREEYSGDIHGNGDLLLIRILYIKIKTAPAIICGHEADISDVAFAI